MTKFSDAPRWVHPHSPNVLLSRACAVEFVRQGWQRRRNSRDSWYSTVICMLLQYLSLPQHLQTQVCEYLCLLACIFVWVQWARDSTCATVSCVRVMRCVLCIQRIPASMRAPCDSLTCRVWVRVRVGEDEGDMTPGRV